MTLVIPFVDCHLHLDGDGRHSDGRRRPGAAAARPVHWHPGCRRCGGAGRRGARLSPGLYEEPGGDQRIRSRCAGRRSRYQPRPPQAAGSRRQPAQRYFRKRDHGGHLDRFDEGRHLGHRHLDLSANARRGMTPPHRHLLPQCRWRRGAGPRYWPTGHRRAPVRQRCRYLRRIRGLMERRSAFRQRARRS